MSTPKLGKRSGSAPRDFSRLASCVRHPLLFRHPHDLGTPSGTIIVDMDNQAILKVNLEDLPDDQKALIERATEESHEKCLLSYSRTHNLVI